MITLLAALLLQIAPLDLRLAAVGRDAYFVDQGSLTRDGAQRTFRALRIVPGGEPIAGELYFGGWQRATIACEAKTYTALSFQSLRESGVVGPDQPGRRIAPYAIAEGSSEDGLRAAVCDGAYKYSDHAPSITDAAKLGRQRIDDEFKRQIREGGG